MPMPPFNQKITNMQPNPFASLPMAELIQQDMNAIGTPSPLLPMPEINQRIMSAMQKPNPETFANFPASPGFGIECEQEKLTTYTKVYEQEYLKCSAREFAANLQLDVDKMIQMLPSSSKSSHQPQEILKKILQQQIFEEIQKQKTSEKFQEQLARDGTNREASKAAGPSTTGGSLRLQFKKEKLLMQALQPTPAPVPVLAVGFSNFPCQRVLYL